MVQHNHGGNIMEILKRDNRDPYNYTLQGNSAWITVDDLFIWIRKTDKYAVVEIFPHDEEMGDTIAEVHAPLRGNKEIQKLED